MFNDTVGVDRHDPEQNDRLVAARDAFREAQRVLHAAREDLFREHTATARLWIAGR